ncbi:MAG: alanine--tRNA ligase [Cyclobacteriaceae bacterium]
MDSRQIRQEFLDFFRNKQHKVVASAPIVVKNDPTLMFTNAGMNQFKDYFLGNKPVESTRITDTQKCLRVSGKHNDLEEVGFDTYHHTMFEMLGNWSFGDYFKKDAIDWAWELLTEVYKLPKDKLYVTVFEGDQSENLAADNEAKDFWKKHLPLERILNGNKKDNFWEMGETGPCGPCSEIHIDLRPQVEIDQLSGDQLVNQDHPQVVEVWNLVFMQFNRLADGSLKSLPAQHVDTGMGFERLAMAIQGKTSNYDTDVFQPLIQQIAKDAQVIYGSDEQKDVAIRVIADHIRAISFTIADGQLPSNTGAGYVIRRILRRAVRYGYTFLNFKEARLYSLVPLLAEQLADTFPELIAQQDFVAKVIKEEENSFLRTLENGLKRFDAILESDTMAVSGKVAFELYDTYGFPIDLTMLLAKENKLSVDENEFKEELKKQKERSKSDAKQTLSDWQEVLAIDATEFIGYEHLTSKSRIARYRKVDQKDVSFYQIVLDKSPFYAESGGQVGDSGVLISGEEKISIFDTKKENDLIIHYAKKLPVNTEVEFEAIVDKTKRKLTENNHSATHLLHAALREILGDHVQQKGSLVHDKSLRFDFSHFAKVEEEDLKKIEQIVNNKIRENIHLNEQRNVPIEKAKDMGAMALFGEKYGDFVRVITFDQSYSVELCGGTHVESTGQIGLFKIVSESSVAAGVRRIEAVTADGAEKIINGELNLLAKVKSILKNPKDLEKAIQGLIDENGRLEKTLDTLNREKASGLKNQLIASKTTFESGSFIAAKIEIPSADLLKQLSFELKRELPGLILLLAANINEKPMLSVMIDESIVQEKGLNASEITRKMAKEIKGGGGGQPFYSTAGGKELQGLDAALNLGKGLILEKVSVG